MTTYGDLVHVVADLGPHMRYYFNRDCDAIVIGSDDSDNFTLYFRGVGPVSWYHVSQFTLVERNRIDILDEWKREIEARRIEESDLDWIFSHGGEVLRSASGYSIESLAKCLGIGNLCGSSGEGVTYYRNARRILNVARPYLETGDKNGWLAYCRSRDV